jgi:hypothetical protein
MKVLLGIRVWVVSKLKRNRGPGGGAEKLV